MRRQSLLGCDCFCFCFVLIGLKLISFFQVCLFPRLKDFIMNQDWNDPKSKLQQCCLTLRTMDGGEPDIPIYKVIESIGPTNTRIYTVAVYFREKRLACATGHSIQQAEMNAAKKALDTSQDLFLQLDHQKRVIARSMKRQHVDTTRGGQVGAGEEVDDEDEEGKRGEQRERERKKKSDCNLPKQYRVRDAEDFESSSSSSSSSGSGSSSSESGKDGESSDEEGEKEKGERGSSIGKGKSEDEGGSVKEPEKSVRDSMSSDRESGEIE